MSLQAEGERIASELGVIYNGPQMEGKYFLYHLFTDRETGTTFSARNLPQAKANLVLKRQLFRVKPPHFPEIPDPVAVMESFGRDLTRILRVIFPEGR